MEELEYGGYKCEFVSGGSTPPNQLACSHCTLLLRDPCLVDCCGGAKYCETCVNHLREDGQPCNVCKKQLGNAEPNAKLKRLVVNQKVYCSKKDTNGCEWKGKLLNLAHHEDDQNECPYRPVINNIEQMIHNMEERHKRDLKILYMLSIIMAVGLSLLFQVMITSMTMEQSLTSLKQEMNSELTTAMKKTEESLMSLKQEMTNGLKQETNSELTTTMKKTEESLMSLKQEMNVLKQEMNSELTTAMKKTEESLIGLKQEMNGLKQETNSELTTAMKKTEESLMDLKQEMNGLKQETNSELTTAMKKTEKSLMSQLKQEMNGLKQEMNSDELTTAMKKTEEALLSLKQEMNGLKQEMNSEFATAIKKTEESLLSLKQEMKQEMNSELTITMKKTEESLISLKQKFKGLKQEMNSELTTAMKKTEESLMSLKQEMNGEFATMTKEMKEKIYREIYGGVYIDCKDAYQNGHNTSGVYTINPDNQTVFKVYCDMDTDGGGWTVIQRRFDGSVSFDRNWVDCEHGFGNKTGEHWLGLSYIHRLTTSASQDLRVDLEDFEGGSAYAHYTTFTVANAANSYQLLVSGYSGTAGNGMARNSGHEFTTRDRDNDRHGGNCATLLKGPWWHYSCTNANLNGKYYSSQNVGNPDGVGWFYWKNCWYSLKKASMKLHRKSQ